MKFRITILKYHSWYLCQISLQIVLLPIQIEHYIAQLVNDMVQRNLQIFERYQPAEGLGFDRVNSVTIKKPERKSKAVEVQVQVHLFTLIQLQYNNKGKKGRSKKQS